ncbi:hypothetical protein [Zunongwangia sp. H14]|uniref:hypothetical protein n=1 Tax=Zunongwangia sp. H14 TaxID=3240792 RepID=UPI0035684A55
MKLFPSKEYSITLINESSKAIGGLQKETLSDDQFVSDWNRQTFIGRIEGTEFEVKLSKKLYGAFCILKCKMERSTGFLEIKVNKDFKRFFWILFLFPIIGFTIVVIQNGLVDSTDLIIPTVLYIVVLRFVFIELGFRIISKNGLKKLSQTIGIDKIKRGTTTYKNNA